MTNKRNKMFPETTTREEFDAMIEAAEKTLGLRECDLDKAIDDDNEDSIEYKKSIKNDLDECDELDGLKKNENSISRLNTMIAEEFSAIMEDIANKAPNIAVKLEDLRQTMLCDMLRPESIGDATKVPFEKRILAKTVADMIDEPVNELILYFLNNVKASNFKHAIEYHLGQVVFKA